MHCEQAEMLIPQFIYNELSAEDTSLVSAHLATCASCTQSCKELKELIDTRLQPRDIYLPYVGCGNGNLDKSLVTPILEKYFSNNDKVFLVDYEQ